MRKVFILMLNAKMKGEAIITLLLLFADITKCQSHYLDVAFKGVSKFLKAQNAPCYTLASKWHHNRKLYGK